MVIRTSLPTTTPPSSISPFQLTPKSLRSIVVVATKPARAFHQLRKHQGRLRIGPRHPEKQQDQEDCNPAAARRSALDVLHSEFHGDHIPYTGNRHCAIIEVPMMNQSRTSRLLLTCTCLLLMTSCQTVREAAIEDVETGTKLSDYRMISLTGRRDGDRLPVQVVFEAGSSQLRMDLRFRIGVPTRLESGGYSFEQADRTLQGRVRERSATFLGGQSDNPNLGGVFELLSREGAPLYKVSLPTSEVKRPDSGAPSMTPSH